MPDVIEKYACYVILKQNKKNKTGGHVTPIGVLSHITLLTRIEGK